MAMQIRHAVGGNSNSRLLREPEIGRDTEIAPTGVVRFDKHIALLQRKARRGYRRRWKIDAFAL